MRCSQSSIMGLTVHVLGVLTFLIATGFTVAFGQHRDGKHGSRYRYQVKISLLGIKIITGTS
jgi:hypothetical protein